jgi:hypothetical protein
MYVYMVKAVTKTQGTTFPDFFNSVPIGSDKSESARSLWMKSGMNISYDTFNRILGKLALVDYNGAPLISRRKSGVSFLYWRDLKEFPSDVRYIE